MPDSHPDFDALLRRAHEGNAQALLEVLQFHAAGLRIIAQVHLRYAGQRLVESEDVVQSAFKDILQDFAEKQLNAPNIAELLGLAHTIIVNKVRNLYRRRVVEDRLFGLPLTGDAQASALADIPCPQPGPERDAQLHDLVATIRDRLNGVDRQLLDLCVQGVSAAAAARELGLTPEAGRMRLARLRKHLMDAGLLGPWLDGD